MQRRRGEPQPACFVGDVVRHVQPRRDRGAIRRAGVSALGSPGVPTQPRPARTGEVSHRKAPMVRWGTTVRGNQLGQACQVDRRTSAVKGSKSVWRSNSRQCDSSSRGRSGRRSMNVGHDFGERSKVREGKCD